MTNRSSCMSVWLIYLSCLCVSLYLRIHAGVYNMCACMRVRYVWMCVHLRVCVCAYVCSHVYVFLTNQQGRCMKFVAEPPEIVSFTVNSETGSLTLNESAADIVPISCVARGYPLPTVTLYKVNILFI